MQESSVCLRLLSASADAVFKCEGADGLGSASSTLEAANLSITSATLHSSLIHAGAGRFEFRFMRRALLLEEPASTSTRADQDRRGI